jgi:hypothetical protein
VLAESLKLTSTALTCTVCVATALLSAFGAAAVDCEAAMPGTTTVPLYDDKSATCNSMATQTIAVQSTKEVGQYYTLYL